MLIQSDLASIEQRQQLFKITKRVQFFQSKGLLPTVVSCDKCAKNCVIGIKENELVFVCTACNRYVECHDQVVMAYDARMDADVKMLVSLCFQGKLEELILQEGPEQELATLAFNQFGRKAASSLFQMVKLHGDINVLVLPWFENQEDINSLYPEILILLWEKTSLKFTLEQWNDKTALNLYQSIEQHAATGSNIEIFWIAKLIDQEIETALKGAIDLLSKSYTTSQEFVQAKLSQASQENGLNNFIASIFITFQKLKPYQQKDIQIRIAALNYARKFYCNDIGSFINLLLSYESWEYEKVFFDIFRIHSDVIVNEILQSPLRSAYQSLEKNKSQLSSPTTTQTGLVTAKQSDEQSQWTIKQLEALRALYTKYGDGQIQDIMLHFSSMFPDAQKSIGQVKRKLIKFKNVNDLKSEQPQSLVASTTSQCAPIQQQDSKILNALYYIQKGYALGSHRCTVCNEELTVTSIEKIKHVVGFHCKKCNILIDWMADSIAWYDCVQMEQFEKMARGYAMGWPSNYDEINSNLKPNKRQSIYETISLKLERQLPQDKLKDNVSVRFYQLDYSAANGVEFELDSGLVIFTDQFGNMRTAIISLIHEDAMLQVFQQWIELNSKLTIQTGFTGDSADERESLLLQVIKTMLESKLYQVSSVKSLPCIDFIKRVDQFAFLFHTYSNSVEIVQKNVLDSILTQIVFIYLFYGHVDDLITYIMTQKVDQLSEFKDLSAIKSNCGDEQALETEFPTATYNDCPF